MLVLGRVAAVLIMIAALVGCTTPYGRPGVLNGGYTDEAIGGDQYHISIQVNLMTGVGGAEEYFFRRAQEIVKEHGYEGYRTVNLRSGVEYIPGGARAVARGVIQGYRSGDKAPVGGGPAVAGGPIGNQRPTYSGTGFFLGSSGFVLTNQHVVARCRDITIRQFDGSVTSATVLASDAANDLAILKSAAKSPAYARLRDGADVRRGDSVIAFGFPRTDVLSAGGSVTSGTVSALAGPKDDSRMLQISAPIQPGNSGGPLLDQSGNVVGITSAALVERAGGVAPQNVNFAIKASVARSFLEAHAIAYQQAPSTKALSTSDIAEKAEKFAVYIVCTGA
jgi:S1-C subfamily serine protease